MRGDGNFQYAVAPGGLHVPGVGGIRKNEAPIEAALLAFKALLLRRILAGGCGLFMLPFAGEVIEAATCEASV